MELVARPEAVGMRVVTAWVTGALLLAAAPSPAAAEPFLDLATGKSSTARSDVHIEQPLGNDFTVRDMAFEDRSFENPPVYGVRAGYSFERLPWLGVALEFFHFKMIDDTSAERRLTGTRSGAWIDATVRVDSVVQRFPDHATAELPRRGGAGASPPSR